jgi:hypothetical protein
MTKHTMKNKFIRSGIKSLQNISLHPDEKQEVLSHLLAHAEAHPPLAPRKSFIQDVLASPYQAIFAFKYEYAIASAVIILVAGGAVTSASENALPGDLLYPIKIGVTEPLRGMLVVGDVANARWEVEKTVRRLEEVETLAAQGRLTEPSLQLAQDNFQKNATEFNAIVQSSEAIASSTQLVDARIDFEAKMSAHSVILSSVASSSLVVEQKLFAPLVAAVEENAHQSRENRADSVKVFLQSVRGNRTGEDHKGEEKDSRGGEKNDTRKLFESKAQSVQTIIDATTNRLSDMASSTAAASTSVQAVILDTVPATLKSAENALKDAKEKQDSGESDKAFSALLDSESAAKQADVSVKQGVRLGREERESQKEQHSDTGSKNDSHGQDGGGKQNSDDRHNDKGRD